MRKSLNTYRKRPFVLPPLPDSQPLLRPIDPLQPPDLILMEGRLGSPAPKPAPYGSDYNFDNSNDGKPAIKVSESEDNLWNNDNRESMGLDFLTDPLFVDDGANLFMNFQKRNSVKTSGDKSFETENLLNAFSRNHLKNIHSSLDKKKNLSTVQPLTETKCFKRKPCSEIKIVQIPNRYTPLKPIGHYNDK